MYTVAVKKLDNAVARLPNSHEKHVFGVGNLNVILPKVLHELSGGSITCFRTVAATVVMIIVDFSDVDRHVDIDNAEALLDCPIDVRLSQVSLEWSV